MRKFQFLLLDAGPIIKLFELGIWDKLIKRYQVTIARTVVEQSIHKCQADPSDFIEYPFEEVAQQGLLEIIDVAPSKVKEFIDKFDISSKYAFDEGEDETLAYWFFQGKERQVCSSDGAVFSILGYLSRGEQGGLFTGSPENNGSVATIGMEAHGKISSQIHEGGPNRRCSGARSRVTL